MLSRPGRGRDLFPVRIRTIKPEFWESETLGRVSREARLLFVGLFSCCDDSGRTRASSRLLASRLFPYDEDAAKLLPRWLGELEAEGCVRLYQAEGEQFLDIPKWLAHQKIDKPSPSKFPEFREDSRGFEKNSLGTGNREQGEEQGTGNREELPLVPADPIPKKTLRMQAARPVLHLLNERSGRSFRETEANLLTIAARMEEPGVDFDGVMAMVRRQCLLWVQDPKMSEFLRPETLFGKTKFESYYANRNQPVPPSGSGGFRDGGNSAADIRRSLVAGAADTHRDSLITAAKERAMAESDELPI